MAHRTHKTDHVGRPLLLWGAASLVFAILAPLGVAHAGPRLALRRIGADVVDISLGFGVGFAAVYGINQIAGAGWRTETPGRFFLVNELGVTAPSIAYLTVSDARGGSLGKRLFGLRVVHNGKPPPLGVSLVRSWSSVVGMEAAHIGHAYTFTERPHAPVAAAAYGVGGALFAVKWGAPFATGGARGLEDWIAGTEVVDTRLASTDGRLGTAAPPSTRAPRAGAAPGATARGGLGHGTGTPVRHRGPHEHQLVPRPHEQGAPPHRRDHAQGLAGH